MKLASFAVNGRATFGAVLDDEQLADLGGAIGDCPNLASFIASGRAHDIQPSLTALAPQYKFADVTFLPAIPRPLNILSGGGNFAGHIEEMKRGGMRAGAPPYPVFHMKGAGSLVGHLEPLVKPRVTEQFDWENELAVVIGSPCYRVARDEAMNHVFGYTLLNDGSIRNYQFEHSNGAGKNFHRSSSLGPWIASKDEVGELSDIWLTTRVNGDIVQRECAGSLHFPVDELISYFSQIIALQPGDIVTTGSCGGVGYFHQPPRYLQAGDELEIEADRIGKMRHKIIDDTTG